MNSLGYRTCNFFSNAAPTALTDEQKKIKKIAKRQHSSRRAAVKPGKVIVFTPPQPKAE